jgi:opacity protein-like surface antigen
MPRMARRDQELQRGEDIMNVRYFLPLAALCLAWSAGANAERGVGWDFGADLIYQDSQDIDFKGGSFASLDDDLGIALSFGYRFNSRLELTFGLDWSTVDYNVNVAPGQAGLLGFSANGDLEAFTPRVGLNFNFLEGDVTPYVSAGVGWAFIDTNIPNGPPQTGCYWDPWFGYICSTWQSTRSIDELTYQAGAGIRWDISSGYTLRFGYEKRWIDLGEATSTPGFDLVKLGVTFRY